MPRWASTWMKKSNESSGEKQKGVQEKKTPAPQKKTNNPKKENLNRYLVD